jgi:hypothetical protein
VRRPLLALLVVPAVGLAVAAPLSHATTKTPLAFGKNTFAYSSDFGEPGIAVSPTGTIYVSTPGDGGAVLARSDNQGRSWVKLPSARTDTSYAALPGSDSDVTVAKDGSVYAGDLDVDGITVFRSTDKGRTFPQQTFIHGSADREWLATTGAHGENVFVVWHELATGTMLAVASHDKGKTFGPPELLYSNPQTVAESAHNGTSIGGVSTDDAGRVYVSYGTTRLTTTDTTYGSPPISTIKLAVRDPESGLWTDHLVNAGADDANFGNFWMASAVDRGGYVYAVYSGYAHKGQPMHVWLQQSKDHGVTWTAPYAVDNALPGASGNDLFGWVAGGGKGVAVVSWYHTTASDKNATKIDWRVAVAQVRDLGTARPSVLWGYASDHSVHHGGICTLGIFCGILPGSSSDRTLLDFFKVTVMPDGSPAVVWSDNNRQDGDARTGVGFAKQSGGPSAWKTRP